MVRGVQNALHVVYCHTPARWLYGEAYLHHGRVATAQRLAAPLLRRMRRIDGQAALHVDAYVANSESVRKRVRVAYGRESSVVYPPVDVQRFRPSPRGERLLVISRLLPYKRVDLAIAAARRLGIGLDVVGDGPLRSELRREAGPLTTFYGAASDATVTELLATCSAVCVPGEEDFGIVAVEAQAAGKPVVAFARGGACETVVHGVTGVLFTVQSVECVVSAIAEAARLSTPPDRIAANAARFSRAAFADGLRRAISTLRESHGATRLAVEVGSA
jgi:glycosyltransferase involved in cell wall biosynthesis